MFCLDTSTIVRVVAATDHLGTNFLLVCYAKILRFDRNPFICGVR